MHIVHLITTLDVGGAEMHLLAQVRGQSSRGHEVHVRYLKGHGTLAKDFLAAGARSVERLPLGAGFAFRLARLARRSDIVHTHLLKADMAAAASLALLGGAHKLISSKHNDEQALTRPLFSRIHGLLGRVPRRTIVLSEHVGRFIAEHGRVPLARQRRIYYGLDPAPFRAAAALAPAERLAVRRSFGWDAQARIGICVARFAPQKAHDVLLRAFAAARAQDSHLRLLLVGDDPFGDGRVRAEALAKELKLGTDCVFAGIRRDVPQLMAASDWFVMSSLWEGLGLVFLEAMATRLPVLSTRVSAIPEVVEEGVTGLLVPPSNSESLAAGFLRLARDPKLCAQLGAAGASRVESIFGLDRMVEETLAVYAEVAAG